MTYPDTCAERATCRCHICREATRQASSDAWSILDELAGHAVPPGAEWTITHAALLMLKGIWQAGTDDQARAPSSSSPKGDA